MLTSDGDGVDITLGTQDGMTLGIILGIAPGTTHGILLGDGTAHITDGDGVADGIIIITMDIGVAQDGMEATTIAMDVITVAEEGVLQDTQQGEVVAEAADLPQVGALHLDAITAIYQGDNPHLEIGVLLRQVGLQGKTYLL